MRYISIVFTSFLIGIAIIIGVLIFATPEKCEHEEVTRFHFTTDTPVVRNSVCGYCKKCDTRLTSYSLFQGDLVDKSYRQAIVDHSDGSEMASGEYYTVTATVPLGFIGDGIGSIGLTCEVENEDFIVRFDAEFREEFKEAVMSIEEGEEITFRGRFYDNGCGFTDCELVSNEVRQWKNS